ncbi:hypothetical protein EMCRGX_G009607 [Ephydatia muelleri]
MKLECPDQGSDDKNSREVYFEFDKVFEPPCSQEEVFEDISRSKCFGWLHCIFACGKTDSGKTFTMEGHEDGDDSQRGMIARAVEQVFACSSQLVDKEWQENHPAIQNSALFREAYLGGVNWLTVRQKVNMRGRLVHPCACRMMHNLIVRLNEKGQQSSSHIGNLKAAHDLLQKVFSDRHPHTLLMLDHVWTSNITQHFVVPCHTGYPMALTLIGANLKTGAKKAKWKQIAEKLEQSHVAVNVQLRDPQVLHGLEHGGTLPQAEVPL